MNSLDWLRGRKFPRLEHREYDWVLVFDDKGVIVISCLWRLLERGHIRRTSSDHGQQFGLPAPVNVADETNRLLQSASIDSVTLKTSTLDIELGFSNGYVFQILPDSSGYESWIAYNNTSEFIATGGGRLDTIPARDG